MFTQLDDVKNYKNEEKFQTNWSFLFVEWNNFKTVSFRQAETTVLLQWKDAEMTFKAKTAAEWKDFEEIAY